MEQKKGKKITRKHIWSVILVITVLLTSFGMPGVTQKVHGQETRVIEAPSSASYISNVVEGEGFKASNFNSIYNKDKQLWQKVYFGKNDMDAQRWNIVGENEDGSLVLLCDMGQPICGNQPFNSSAEDIEDLNRIKGDYSGDKPQSVYANHYGSSELRIYLQSLTEGTANEKFSVAEQKLMQDATVRCYDMKNSKSYTVTDKLYVPDGEYEGEYNT